MWEYWIVSRKKWIDDIKSLESEDSAIFQVELDKLAEDLNNESKEGWELLLIYRGLAFFRRAIRRSGRTKKKLERFD